LIGLIKLTALIKERQRQKEEMESKKLRRMNIIARLYFSFPYRGRPGGGLLKVDEVKDKVGGKK
jgi:hypothetical protein